MFNRLNVNADVRFQLSSVKTHVKFEKKVKTMPFFSLFSFEKRSYFS